MMGFAGVPCASTKPPEEITSVPGEPTVGVAIAGADRLSEFHHRFVVGHSCFGGERHQFDFGDAQALTGEAAFHFGTFGRVA